VFKKKIAKVARKRGKSELKKKKKKEERRFGDSSEFGRNSDEIIHSPESCGTKY